METCNNNKSKCFNVNKTCTLEGDVLDVPGCESNPCGNDGTCTDSVNGYTCKCVPGYGDANCQTSMYDYQKWYEAFMLGK